MFSIAFSGLFGQDAVHRRPAHAEGVAIVLADSLFACIRMAKAAFFSSSALGRPMCCPRERRASRAAARRSRKF
jgi:hypothetical protein